MHNQQTKSFVSVVSVEDEGKGAVRQPMGGFSIEVITLLDVLSRIEVRRQKRLYDDRKGVV